MTTNQKRTRVWRKMKLNLKGSHHKKREKGFTYDFDAIETAMLLNGKDRCMQRELV